MKYIIIIITCIFSSCNSTFDRKDYTAFSKKLLSVISNDDTVALKDIFSYKIDSLDDFQIKQTYEAIEYYKDKNIKFLKWDTSTFYNNKTLYIYFKIDSSYHRINCIYQTDDIENISAIILYSANISNNCQEWYTQPYCPKYDINFKRISWKTDYDNKSFLSAKVELENRSMNDIDWIKFRIILKNNEVIFFTQTIVSNQKIFSGDRINIDIPGLTDYYTGFPINRNNLQFDSELIEVRPKPESGDCIEINELKLLK